LNVPFVSCLKNIVYYSTGDEAAPPGTIGWNELEQMSTTALVGEVRNTKIRQEEIGNIQFTSGTTGMPKAAALSHYNLVNNALSVGMHCNAIEDNWNDRTIVCNVLPLYHVFGFVAGSLSGAIFGSSQVYPAPGFNADAAVKAIEKQKATHLIGTPTMFNDIINCKIELIAT